MKGKSEDKSKLLRPSSYGTENLQKWHISDYVFYWWILQVSCDGFDQDITI